MGKLVEGTPAANDWHLVDLLITPCIADRAAPIQIGAAAGPLKGSGIPSPSAAGSVRVMGDKSHLHRLIPGTVTIAQLS